MQSAAGDDGTLARAGSLIISSHVGRLSATSTYATMSRAADSPMVPASATSKAFFVIMSRFLIMKLALCNDLGDTKDFCGVLGLKMYGFSDWLGSV